MLLSISEQLTYFVAKNLDLTLGEGFAGEKNLDLFVETSDLVHVNNSNVGHFVFQLKLQLINPNKTTNLIFF